MTKRRSTKTKSKCSRCGSFLQDWNYRFLRCPDCALLAAKAFPEKWIEVRA